MDLAAALALVDAHETASGLDDFDRRLAAALVAQDARSEALPIVTFDGDGLALHPLIVALQLLAVERALVVTSNLDRVDVWGQRFTWCGAPRGQALSYGYSDDDPAVHGVLHPHHIVTMRHLTKYCEHWERKAFDLVVFDRVDQARGLDWLSTRPRRVWWLTDLPLRPQTPAEVLATTGALPQPPPGVRSRRSPLAERVS